MYSTSSRLPAQPMTPPAAVRPDTDTDGDGDGDGDGGSVDSGCPRGRGTATSRCSSTLARSSASAWASAAEGGALVARVTGGSAAIFSVYSAWYLVQPISQTPGSTGSTSSHTARGVSRAPQLRVSGEVSECILILEDASLDLQDRPRSVGVDGEGAFQNPGARRHVGHSLRLGIADGSPVGEQEALNLPFAAGSPPWAMGGGCGCRSRPRYRQQERGRGALEGRDRFARYQRTISSSHSAPGST